MWEEECVDVREGEMCVWEEGGVCVWGGRVAMYASNQIITRSMTTWIEQKGGEESYILLPLTKEVCCDVVTDDHGDREKAPEETLKNVLSDKVGLRAEHEEGQVRPAKLGEREGREGRRGEEEMRERRK